MTPTKYLKLAAAVAATLAVSGVSHAADSAALVDALVKKGILSSKEAEDIRADMTKSEGSGDKIKLSNSVTELKLYGDMRVRYQYDNKDAQVDPLPRLGESSRSPSGAQRSRVRFRLRLDGEVKLGENFFGGFELQTNATSRSGNQTFENGFDDYGIYVSKAYLGWKPADWSTVTLGKVGNPFYTTDLVWDPDITPNGVFETLAFHKLLAPREEAGLSKDGKSVAPAPALPWELTLVAGQMVFDDNLEGGGNDNATRDSDSTTDAWLFETQLVGSYKFDNGIKVTLAPAWMTYVNGSVSGLTTSNAFQDSPLVSGATRNLNIVLAPGDVSFKIGSLKAKGLWDFAYNIEGRKRAENIYRMVALRAAGPGAQPDPDDFQKLHNNQDDYSFLVGFQLGENKKKGDWSVLANYRQTGLASIDPNLTDDDFGLGELNQRGFRMNAAYNFTDFCVGAVTYYTSWGLRDNLVGGEATGGNAIGDGNSAQVLLLDLMIKF